MNTDSITVSITLAEKITILSNVVVAFAAVVAVIIAVIGLRSWKRQTQWRSEYDVARKIQIAVYKLRNAIAHVRNIGMLAAEYVERPGRDPNAKTVDYEDTRYAYQKRWDWVIKARDELNEALFEAEALWGPSLEKHKEELYACISELWVNLTLNLRLISEKKFSETISVEKRKNISAVIFEVTEDTKEDTFKSKVIRTVEGFEKTLKSFLPRKSSFPVRSI